ncbi:hypothetical protein JCM9279_000033 [Rhodotorula babjevae]
MAQQIDAKDKMARVGTKSARARDKQHDRAPRTVPSSAPTRPATAPATSATATTSSTPISSSSLSASLSSPPLLGSDNDTPTPAVPTKRAVLQPTSAAEPALRAPSPGASTTSSTSTSSGSKVHRSRSRRRRREEPLGLFSAMGDEAPLVEGDENQDGIEPETQDLFDTSTAPAVAAAAAPVPSTSASAVDSGAAPAPPGDAALLSSLVMQECVRLSNQLETARKELAAAAEREAEQARREAQLVAQVERLEREAAALRSSSIRGHEEKQAHGQSGQGGGRHERGGAARGGGGGPSAAAAHVRPAAAASGQKGSASHKTSQASSGSAAATRTGRKEDETGDESQDLFCKDLVIIHRRPRAVQVNPSASTSALGQVGEQGDQGGSSQGSSQGGAASGSSSGFETIVISDSEADNSNVTLDAAVASVAASSRSFAAATPPVTHRSSLSPGLSSSPDTPSPVRNADAIPTRASSLASPGSDMSIVSASTVPNVAGDYEGPLGNDNTASYDAGESNLSTVGDSSGEVSGGSSFEESRADAGSVGSAGTIIYRHDVESDWSLRTDSQIEPSQPSQLPAAAATPLAASITTTPRAVPPPPAAPVVDALAALSLDPHEVEDEPEPETQETQPVRAPGAYPASDSEEESIYVDAKETQTSP